MKTMKNLILTTVSIVLFFTSCDTGIISKYKKESLPDNFNYYIIEDKSNEALEKNQLTIVINQKITEGQIATLAEKLYDSIPKQRRFYIFIQLQNSNVAWATSHIDPELDIQILGSTSQQDDNINSKANAEIEGEIVGKWKEEQYTSSNYTIFKKDNKIFIRIFFKNGQTSDEELIEKKVSNGTRLDYKKNDYNKEYFIINKNDELEFYNSENKRFTIAIKL